jgi:hypothetical protein
VKKVVELLDAALSHIGKGHELIVMDLIKRAMREAKRLPRRYTPEQWEAETGKPWPDNGLVYCLVEESYCRFPPDAAWVFGIYQWAKNWHPHCPVVCATEAGPPPGGWRPEENKP